MSDRERVPELMDEPGLDADLHAEALEALARVNRVSATGRRVWHEVVRIHRRTGRPVRLLDVACGGGDVLLDVGRRAAQAGVPVELTGCDISVQALDFARGAFERRGLEVDLHTSDALSGTLPADADLVSCSLFLHHLSDGEAEALLRSLSAGARDTLLVQDLRRTRLGYLFAFVGLHALTRSPVARIDGLRSVRAAFDVREVRGLCEAAGLRGCEIRTAWPQRFLIRWRRA